MTEPHTSQYNALTEPKRIASWWIRMEDLNWPSPDGLSKIRRRAESMAQANVTTAMIFGTHFRWDFLPYFTLLHDYLATVAEELHKLGLELYDHHSVNLVHRYDTREEMRHVMLHSGPHLPFSPSREAAKTWEYHGSRLNDWRMIDVKTRDILYYPQYAAEGFCIRNPDFIAAYRDYVKHLIADTGIDGLSADDPLHYMHYNSCACPYCRAELKRRTGMDLPLIDDRSFWGNWENPAWNAWIDLRFDAASEFFSALSEVFPDNFRVTTCGSNSASTGANGKASDARDFLSGCNYVNLEMSGNTPPYKKDPVTNNRPIAESIVNSSHHQASARERGVRCFATGFGFTEETANIVWAVNKMMNSDCWFSTLKDRLGLPEHILNTLPDESDIIGRAFGFEHDHPELYAGEQIGQVGVYFSYETRKHTCFGNLDHGYYGDYRATLKHLFAQGLNPHTLFEFPADTAQYPIIALPSAAKMTEEEIDAMKRYLAAGGIVAATGPCAVPNCVHHWDLPTRPDIDAPTDFFSYIVHGVKHETPAWIRKTKLAPCEEPLDWCEPLPGLFYTPHRMIDGKVTPSFLNLCRKHIKPLPVTVTQAQGYLVSMMQNGDDVTVHLLAEDFDTDIDHHLDEIRFHRSRVNYINRVTPIGISDTVTLHTTVVPTVYTPFSQDTAKVYADGESVEIHLPHNTSYAVLHFQI